MNGLHGVSLLMLMALASGCDRSTATTGVPDGPIEPVDVAVADAVGIPASGTFTQTTITSLEVRAAGPNTVIEQTSEGTIGGTISGPYTDDLRVVIHPDGKFNAHFTIRCECEVQGAAGVLEFMASDTGELTGPNSAEFAGRAVVVDATGGLEGTHGVLQIAGTVDVASGLSTYTYSGVLR